MNELEKMILIFSIVIIIFILLGIYNFINKNKELISNIRKTTIIYEAIITNKRHYTENNHNLYYVEFMYGDTTKEFIVKDYIYHSLNINQKGYLKLKYDTFVEFK